MTPESSQHDLPGTAPEPGTWARDTLAATQARLGLDAAESARLAQMWTFELDAAALGFSAVAGVDEAGRGPLAGPIVAGAAILAEPLAGLNDSKQLTEERREALYEELVAGEHAVAAAVIEADELDAMGLQQANYAAMARAVDALPRTPDYLLVDGFALKGIAQPALKVIKGDARSLSIAAASIMAKVTRDRLMKEWNERHPGYGFDRHKGYGTKEHLAALERLGPCPIHRRSFAPIARLLDDGVV